MIETELSKTGFEILSVYAGGKENTAEKLSAIRKKNEELKNERANLFYRAYKNSSQEKSILLILIYGIRNKEIKNKQIQIDPNLKFEGYVLTEDQMEKLDTKEF